MNELLATLGHKVRGTDVGTVGDDDTKCPFTQSNRVPFTKFNRVFVTKVEMGVLLPNQTKCPFTKSSRVCLLQKSN